MTGGGESEFAGADEAARRLDAGDGPRGVAADRGDLAMLDDVDARRVRAARVAPGDGVVTRRAAARLIKAAFDRKARVVEIKDRNKPAHRVTVEPFGVDAVQAHGVAAPYLGVALAVGMAEVQDAALRHHAVEVEALFEPLPQLHRKFVEGVVAGQQVIGADDRRVAADVAGAEPALLQHRDIADAELAREIEGGRKSMAAAADNDDIVARLRLGRAPGARPVAIAAQALPEERKGGVAHRRRQSAPRGRARGLLE